MAGRVANCGDDVWCGNATACDGTRAGFDLIAHAWKPEDAAWFCPYVAGKLKPDPQKDLIVQMFEHRRLAEGSLSIDQVVAFFRQPGRVLCHCCAGCTRGPTLAMLAKVVRGCDPFQAIADIIRSTRQQYPSFKDESAFANYLPWLDIFVFSESRNPQ